MRRFLVFCSVGVALLFLSATPTEALSNVRLTGTSWLRGLVRLGGDSAVSANVFRPETYGAKADNSTDSTVGIQQAIAAAKAYGAPATVLLSAGTYRVSCIPGQGPSELASTQYCFDINSTSNLTIKGKGSDRTHFVVTTPTSGLFSISYNRYSQSESPSENITFLGFSVDYDPLPFTQGTIVAVNASANTIDVQLDAGYPLPDSESFAPQIYAAYSSIPLGQLVSPTSLVRKPGAEGWYFTESAGQVSGPIWRYHDTHGLIGAKAAVDDRFFAIGGRGGSEVFEISGVTNATVRDVAIYASAGGAFNILETSGTITLDSVQVRPKPDTNRILSVNSNTTISVNNRSSQRITNGYFEAGGDDFVDSGSGSNLIKVVASSTQIGIESGSTIHQGDWLQILDSCGTLRGEAGVKAVSLDHPYGTYTVTLDRPISGMQSSGGDASCTVGGGSSAAPYDSDVVYNLTAAGPNMLIQNSTFRNAPSRMRVRGPGSRILDNTFVDAGLIDLNYEPFWRSGPLAGGITIARNMMSSHYAWPGYIFIHRTSGQRIIVSNNTIADSQPGAFYIDRASNIVLSDNSIVNDETRPTTASPGWLDNASGILINGLTVNDPNSSAPAGLYIGPNVSPGGVGVRINGLDTSGLNPAVPAIKDERP